MQGKNLEIRQYIDVLSKNIRYMFKSGMRTVPLSEELQNIEAYFEMQELKYPGAVFYCVQAQPQTQQLSLIHILSGWGWIRFPGIPNRVHGQRF